MDFLLILKHGFSLILSPHHLIFGFIRFLISSAFFGCLNHKISSPFDPSLTFDHRLFIFNPNLGVDLKGQLLLKYKVKFDNFSLFGILCLLAFYSYVNCLIWISFDQSS